MRILLTGGHGMVGRNVREAAPEGVELLVPGREELDLLDHAAVDAWIDRHGPDAIVHAAGIVGGIQANIDEPVRFLHDNMIMGFNLVHTAREKDVKRLLNLGSSCMYPRAAVNPLAEDVILTGELEPTNEGYAIAKIATARLCEYVSREDAGFLYRTAIPCNLFGRHDHFDLARSHMIPAAIRKVVEANEKSGDVEIWGDGEARREFMYAGDLADFVFHALDRLEEMPSYLNVGVGHDYTINEYYDEIARVVGFNGECNHDLTKPTGMKQKLVDTTQLSAFGWRPKLSLGEGLSRTIDFFKETRAA